MTDTLSSRLLSAINNIDDVGCRRRVTLILDGEFDDVKGELRISDYSGNPVRSYEIEQADSVYDAITKLASMLTDED